jgi:hypothetical protein
VAIIGVLANSLSGGTINTDWTYSLTHNFGASSIWGQPVLQFHGETDDETEVDTWVAEFVEGGQKKTGYFGGIFSNNCTSITYKLYVRDCFARAKCVTMFFG